MSQNESRLSSCLKLAKDFFGMAYAIQSLMRNQLPVSKIILYESLGFLAIVALSWLDDLLALPSLLLYGSPLVIDFYSVAIKILIVLAIWYLVACATRRLLLHMHYLEGFMRVCSWCHHIHFKDEWIKLEDFLEKGLDTPTTHGICPGCLQQQKTAVERAQQLREKLPVLTPQLKPEIPA